MPKKSVSKDQEPTNQPWLPFKTGLIVLGIVSLSLTIWVIATSNPEIPLIERISWALVFGGSIWPIFFLFVFINRLFRRK